MGDLIGFDGYLNESTPFKTAEYPVAWKSQRRYLDFNIGQEYNETCQFPRMWDESGYPVGSAVMNQFKGCYNGDFDQVNNNATPTAIFSLNSTSVWYVSCTNS